MRIHYKYLLVAAILLVSSCANLGQEEKAKAGYILPDSLSTKRMQFVLKLKSATALKSWKTFAEKEVEGPFIYYNQDVSEVFFPNDLLHDRLSGLNCVSNDYCVSKRVDTIPYHFNLMLSLDSADMDKYYYRNGVMQFIRVEEVEQFIPTVKTTELWSTMVIHELFHQFEFNHKEMLDYADSLSRLPYDIRNLVGLMYESEDFRERVKAENNLLRDAISDPSDRGKRRILKEYLQRREARLMAYAEVIPGIEAIEDFYKMHEGCARYLEYRSMLELHNAPVKDEYSPLLQTDPKFMKFEEFRDFSLENENFRWLEIVGKQDYHYGLGFNLVRCLDALGVDFKDDLFEHPERSLDAILEETISRK